VTRKESEKRQRITFGSFPIFFTFFFFTEEICVERGNALMLTKIFKQMFTAYTA
jgi:hypothetical protein